MENRMCTPSQRLKSLTILATVRLLLMGAALAALVPAQAQLGERAVKFILPVATASGVDTITRAAQPALTKALASPIVAATQPGAAGMVGTSALGQQTSD